MRTLTTNRFRKTLFAALATLMLLAAVEGGLRLTAWLARRGSGTPEDADYLLLAVGDSFTHGIKVEPFESYPARLESLLQAGRPSPDLRVRVRNEGEPGASAARVLERLPGLLDRFDPDGVLILAGWNCSDDEFEDWTGADRSTLSGLRRALRQLRLYRVLLDGISRLAARSDDEVVPPGGGGAGAGPGEIRASHRKRGREGNVPETRIFPIRHYDFRAYQEINRANLDSIARLLAERRVRGLLQTYPVKLPPRNAYTDRELYHWKKKFRLGRDVKLAVLGRDDYLYPDHFDNGEIALNAVIREVAAERNVLLVDHARRFEEEEESVVFLPGWTEEHPSARGYEIMASDVFRAIRRAGWVNPRGAGGDDTPR